MSPLPWRSARFGSRLCAMRSIVSLCRHRWRSFSFVKRTTRLCPPSLELGEFAADECLAPKVPTASERNRGWPARRRSPSRARSAPMPGSPPGVGQRSSSHRAQRDQQQRLVDAVEPQQLGSAQLRLALRSERPVPFDAPCRHASRLDDQRRAIESERHEERAAAIAGRASG